MSFLSDMFGTEYPVIGLVHLKPLPGDPFFPTSSSIQDVITAARHDLLALQRGGIDGVLITNEFSIPYEQHISPVTVGSMCTVVGSLLRDFSVPFGCEAIYDSDATIDVCAATGAAFTRCVFTDVWAGDLGLINRNIAKTLRHKKALGLDSLKLFYFVTSEGEGNIGRRSTDEIIESLTFNCRPDAYVVGGSTAGKVPLPEDLSRLQLVAGDTPLMCGTGCTIDVIHQIFASAHGAFIGTALKREGKIENPVDENRVKTLMHKATEVRGALS